VYLLVFEIRKQASTFESRLAFDRSYRRQRGGVAARRGQQDVKYVFLKRITTIVTRYA